VLDANSIVKTVEQGVTTSKNKREKRVAERESSRRLRILKGPKSLLFQSEEDNARL
jgi:hypothetical protein